MISATPASPVKPPELVVVTGANGFIAQHCVAALLRQGYHVVGTVRSSSKAQVVRNTHADHPHLQTVIVQDITSSQAYLDALHGLSPAAVLHLASPFTYTTTEYERDLMKPAVEGAIALLKAAAQIPSIRRVVQTNSFACIFDPGAGPSPGRVYSARDWSPLTYSDGLHAPDAPSAYRASKVAAERAAWSFMSNSSSPPTFDLVSLCPGMVFGPFLPGGKPEDIRRLNTSNKLVHAVTSTNPEDPIPPTRAPVWVDVRDVAEAHVRSLSVAEAGGGRFLLAAGVYCNQEIADVARKEMAKAGNYPGERLPVGEPGQREAHLHFGVDTGEAERVLGMEWRTLGVCLKELLPQFYELESRVHSKSRGL